MIELITFTIIALAVVAIVLYSYLMMQKAKTLEEYTKAYNSGVNRLKATGWASIIIGILFINPIIIFNGLVVIFLTWGDKDNV